MTVQDISSILFHIDGECKLETAYGEDGSSSRIEHGRCLYFARLELAPKEHPEIKDNQFELSVITPLDGQYYSKGHGGGARGWQGETILFEELIAKASFPNKRTNEPKKEYQNIKNALADMLKEYNCNCNFKIYSEFNGYRIGFGAKFDNGKTYMPIIIQAFKEVQTQL